jgi:hypothetical protein
MISSDYDIIYSEHDIINDIIFVHNYIMNDIRLLSVQFTYDIIPHLTDIRRYIMEYIIAFIPWLILAAQGWTLVGAARCFDPEIDSENVY